MFEFKDINNKKILVSDYLSQDIVKNFFTTRESVVTPKDIANLQKISVDNLNEIANFMGISVENIISPIQTHSSNISVAKIGMSYPETDALVVDSCDIAILLNFADCTPVILYDVAKNIGAIAHAGWRGTVARIVPKTVEFMKENYDSHYSDITAIIGPAISLKNYQVDKNVFDQLRCSMSNEYSDYFIFEKENNKYNVDLKTINEHQLNELGIKRIDKCHYCTYDSVDVFFSYRRENGKTARHSAILKLINHN